MSVARASSWTSSCRVTRSPSSTSCTAATGSNWGGSRLRLDRHRLAKELCKETAIPIVDSKEIIARRCALELRSGEVVNLGLGIPTLTANYLPTNVDVVFHTENGAFGFCARPATLAADSDFTNAGCEPITLNPGAALMDLTTSFGAMRNGYIDVTILGALEVDAEGNLANWACRRQGRWWPGIGGTMDLCYGTPKVIAARQHTDKYGNPRSVSAAPCRSPAADA